MLCKIASASIALLLSASTLFAANPDQPSAHFKVSTPTAVPGRVLAPGSYTIHVVDHLSDRYILSIDGKGGKDHTLFLGIPNKGEPGSTQGEQTWGTDVSGATYLKGWSFPSLPTALEFAYPKNDAVAVAKANNAQVPAIDPESEGILAKTSLSKDEMHIITLWLLSPTSVGPKTPGGIQATKYSQGQSQLASNAHRPAKLPHTASLLPTFSLIGLCSLVLAMGLRVVRLQQQFAGRR